MGAAALIMLSGAASALGDPATDAFRQGAGAYVSPAVAGAGVAAAQARLQAIADELSRGGRPVRIAVVPGPVGSPSMNAYAERLRRNPAFGGLVVTVAPNRSTGTAGPRSQAAVTRDLRAARIGTIVDPVERAGAAASAAAGPLVTPSSGETVRALLGLLGIALIGGVWAAAFGIRRNLRVRRNALVETTAMARVRLDAIGARLDVLAMQPERHARADDRLDAATRIARRAQAELDRVGAADDIPAIDALVDEAFSLLREAEEAGGIPSPRDPFEGLCRADPAHGASTTQAPMRPDDITRPSCHACREKADEGHPQLRRMVPSPWGPAPFDDADAV